MNEGMCTKKVLAEWAEKKHGPYSEAFAIARNLPKDKFDAAFWGFLIHLNSKIVEKKFVVDFIITGSMF